MLAKFILHSNPLSAIAALLVLLCAVLCNVLLRHQIVPKQDAARHTVITKDAKEFRSADIDDTPLDVVLLDCHYFGATRAVMEVRLSMLRGFHTARGLLWLEQCDSTVAAHAYVICVTLKSAADPFFVILSCSLPSPA